MDVNFFYYSIYKYKDNIVRVSLNFFFRNFSLETIDWISTKFHSVP